MPEPEEGCEEAATAPQHDGRCTSAEAPADTGTGGSVDGGSADAGASTTVPPEGGAEDPRAEVEAAEAAGSSADALPKRDDKDAGKEEYQKGNYEAAIKAWSRSLSSAKYILDKGLYNHNEEQLMEVKTIELRLNLNLSQANLKAGNFTEAVNYADKALACSPNNTKALYRKASALMRLLSFAEAAEVLDQLLQAEPGNAAGKAMLAEARRNAVLGERRAKRMSQKMFAGLGGAGDGGLPASAQGRLAQLCSAPARLLLYLPAWCRDLLQRIYSPLRVVLEPVRYCLEAMGLLAASSTPAGQKTD